jgi:16S rRNA processing protein RimM
MAASARICLGQIGAAHGVRGEVRLLSFTSDPQAIARYGPLQTADGRSFEIESLRPAKDHFIARLAGIRDRSAAEQLASQKLYVPRERLPTPAQADEFYHADLIGLAVVDRAGQTRGSVVAIHNFGAGDLIEVRFEGNGETDFVPFDVIHVPMVDIKSGRLVIEPSPFAGEGGKPKPSRVRTPAAENPGGQPLTQTAVGLRRQRSTLSRNGRR